jgi:hypothetical protein
MLIHFLPPITIENIIVPEPIIRAAVVPPMISRRSEFAKLSERPSHRELFQRSMHGEPIV